MMASLRVVDAKGKQTGSLELKPDVFAEVNVPLLHQAVVRELADRRVGTHDTKGRSEVSGGGKKPWKQKGTGRARQGSIRATQWKGGGKPFGPTPRRYDKAMPREMRREALRSAVAARAQDDALTVVDALADMDGKTKSLMGQLTTLGVSPPQRTLVVVSAMGDPIRRAARNVPWLTVTTPGHVSTYQVMQARKLVFERAALVALEEALAR
jgi:large subunit ribosomal protein L4